MYAMKHTPIKTITYMALMAALNVLFALLSMFIPLAGLLLAIALPLTGALVALRCDLRYYPIYFAATLGLSLIVTMQQLETTLFYIFPSLLLGLAFGALYKIKAGDPLVIIAASLVQLGLLYLTIILIDAIFMVDFITSLLMLLGLEQEAMIDIILPTLLYVISLAQTTLTYIVMAPELKKLLSMSNEGPLPEWTYVVFLVVAAAIIPLGYVLPSLSFVLLGPVFIMTGSAIFAFLEQKKFKHLLIAGVLLLACVFVTAALFPLLGSLQGLLIIVIFPLSILTMKIMDFHLPIMKRRIKMKPRGNP